MRISQGYSRLAVEYALRCKCADLFVVFKAAEPDMLVDEYEQYPNNNDRTDVVVVSRSGSEEPEQEPLADDRKSPPSLFSSTSSP